MPIDASIYQNFLRAPKSIQEYDNESDQQQQNALALQNAKIQQNALQQQQADSATYRNALKGFGSDATANYNTLIRAGLGAQAEAYKKNATDQEKVKADADKARFDAAAKKIDIAGQAFNYVRLNPTLDNANAVIDYLGQNGIYSPEQVAQYKAQVQQNPDGIGNLAEMAFRSALNTKEQLANIQTRNLGGTTDTLSIDPVTGATKTVNSVRNTVSPGDLLQAETTRRGQNMVDARAREANQANMSKPFEVTGQDGQPMLVQQDKQGNIRPVQGYGPKAQPDKPLTEGQAKANAFGSRMVEARDIINNLESRGVSNRGSIKATAEGVGRVLGLGTDSMGGTLADIAGNATNWTQSEDQQRYEGAKLNWIAAAMRKESGAVIGPGEYRDADNQYFPQPGDDKQAIEDKRRRREIAEQTMLAEVPKEKRNSISGNPEQPKPGATLHFDANGNRVK